VLVRGENTTQEGFGFPPPACDCVILALSNGEHLLLRDGPHALQVKCEGDCLCQGQARLFGLVAGADRLERNLHSLRQFAALYRRGGWGRPLFPPDPRGRRLLFVLRVLDGCSAGASHREVAIALLGETRIKADWNDPRGVLKDQIRNAMKRGYFLMRSGYRSLLL